MHMKKFHIFAHKNEGTVAVKAGFSWPAFFFGFFWLLSKKLWKYAAIWFAVVVAVGYLDGFIQADGRFPGMQSLIGLVIITGYLVIMLIPAFMGNYWRTQDLTRRGYVFLRTVDAASPTKALQAHQTAQRQGPMPPVPS